MFSRYTHGSGKDAVHLPKTFTTRKGALLLFSEDMAGRSKHPTDHPHHRRRHKVHHSHSDQDIVATTQADSADNQDLKTVDDLAKSILAYGSFVSRSLHSIYRFSVFYFQFAYD